MRGRRATRLLARAAVASCAVLLALAATVTGCGGREPTTSLKGFTRTPAPQVGGLNLPDVAAAGAPMRLRAARGGLLLLYFGYTSCPDVCPTTFADVSAALAQLPAGRRKAVTVALVTVDPARDTPKVLGRYMRHFFSDWHALRTTDRRKLRTVERAFGASHKAERARADGTYAVSHTALLYAIDEHGAVRVEWPFGTTAADIAADLRTLTAGLRQTT